MMDNGFPFTTEPNILKSMIIPPTMFNRVANMVSTRSNVAEELPEGPGPSPCPFSLPRALAPLACPEPLPH